MEKLNSALIIILSLAILLAVPAYLIPDPRINSTSKKFIKAMIEADAPERYCCGDVLFNISNSELVPAETIGVSATILENTRSYARVYVVAEMQMADGIDVGFYEIMLFKDKAWKVYSIHETLPYTISVSLPIKPRIDGIYEKCVYQLARGDGRLLAGPARTAYQIQDGIQGEITNFKTKISYNNKLVIAQHTYKYDGRDVKVLVHYYLTTDGYKVVSIQAL